MSYETDVLSHGKALHAFAMHLCHNATLSEDLVQETMLVAFTKQHQFQDGTNLRAWLFTILRNKFLDNNRKSQRLVADVDDSYTAHLTVNPEQEIQIQWGEFNKLIEGMDEEKRRSLQLVLLDGFSYEEAAEIEDVAVGTMKSRVSRARAYITERMECPDTDAVSIGVQITNDNIRYGHR